MALYSQQFFSLEIFVMSFTLWGLRYDFLRLYGSRTIYRGTMKVLEKMTRLLTLPLISLSHPYMSVSGVIAYQRCPAYPPSLTARNRQRRSVALRA